MLVVKGDRQVKVGHATESKQFNRELTLPDFVDGKSLQSYLTDGGQLVMEAPVLLDRVYNNHAGSTPITSSTSNRLVDTTLAGGRQPASSLGFGTSQLGSGFGNNQSSAYSSTSSTSSFRQDGSGLRDTGSFLRSSPLRDQYSSTASSTSTLIGGGGGGGGSNNNQGTTTFSSSISRPEQHSVDRNNETKNVTYTFDLHQFAPEDIAIQVNDTMLKITALKQERDGSGSAHREYRREIGNTCFSSSH